MRNLKLGRYELGERLAIGGMGEVYLARQAGLGDFNKLVALKLLLPHLAEDPPSVQSFLNEARLQARMSHPNVVQIFDVGEDDGYFYLTMELVRGVSLAKLVRALAAANERLEPDELAYIGRALCEGLHHAHELAGEHGARLDVVHRDVTPHNVLVSVNGEVKLADFGIAKASSEHGTTRAGVIKGKYDYMSPEQARGDPVDRRTDVFGAGVTLFSLCTMKSAFARERDDETLKAIASDPLPNLAALRPDLPPAFVAAVARATEKVAANRFASARELRDALPEASGTALVEALGKRVERLCAQAIAALDEQTRKTQASAPALTAGLSATSGKRQRGFAIVGVAVAVLVLSSALVVQSGLFARAPPAPVPVVAVPPPEPRPVAEPAPAPPLQPEPQPAPEPPARVGVRPAKPPIKRGAGKLTVDAKPWATVFVDGKEIGITPIAEYPVAAGSLTVELKNAKTGKSTTRKVVVAPGASAIVKVDLR